MEESSDDGAVVDMKKVDPKFEEAAGIVRPQDPKSKNREVLVKNLTELDEILKKYLK